MKNPLLGAAVAAALSLGSAAHAASDDELAQIRSQLQNLMQRVDRLEAENDALKAQNDRLRAQTEQVSKQVARSADMLPSVPAVKAVDGPNRVVFKGDVRYRHQQTDDDGASARREEDLLRARLGVDAKINDSIVAGIVFATSSAPGNPRGANVQLDGSFSRKSLYLDLAYFDWTFADNAHFIAGKMRMPFVRPGQSLFWDNDINPEGVALTYRLGSMFGSAWSYWLDENVQSTATTTTSTDTKMYGLQLGNRFDLGGNTLVIAASYYDLAAAQGRRPFYNNAANGNSLTSTGGLAYDFQVVSLMAEYNTRLGALPLQVWADVARNLDAEFDTAYSMGTMVGKASNPGTWETGLAYQLIEKDALFAQHIDSDFGAGLSDADGWVFRTGYAPTRNWVLNATYFKNVNNREVGTRHDFDRLMLDFNTRF
ncbi:putative porin [Steroidobacter cummioxidans]|uniref:putative porin n=1 Tax=Steroidobacter cummioxidans TaxID=1803913 RepID=UPI00137A4A2C|nr:putative porin [Steroidobacter cummioxidans]